MPRPRPQEPLLWAPCPVEGTLGQPSPPTHLVLSPEQGQGESGSQGRALWARPPSGPTWGAHSPLGVGEESAGHFTRLGGGGVWKMGEPEAQSWGGGRGSLRLRPGGCGGVPGSVSFLPRAKVPCSSLLGPGRVSQHPADAPAAYARLPVCGGAVDNLVQSPGAPVRGIPQRAQST